MAGRKGPSASVAPASEPAKRNTKAKAARHAEATGTIAETVKRTDESGTALQGRPSVMTDKVKAEIIERLAAGETLMQICDPDTAMPARSTVMMYAGRDSSFLGDLLRARALWAVAQADKIIEIADESSDDWVEKRGFGGAVELRPNKEVVDRSKLRIETRKWLMERFGKMLFSMDATKITADASNAADDIKKDATVIAPDEKGPDKPVL